MKNYIRRVTSKDQFISNIGLIVLISLLWVYLANANDHFFTAGNLRVLLRLAAINTICGTGITFVLISGGTDLSLGETCAMCGMIAGICVSRFQWPAPAAILLALLMGILVGVVNGTLVSVFKLQPMICTLGTKSIIGGAALIMTQGYPVPHADRLLTFIGNGRVLGVNFPVWIALFIFVIGYIILNYTETGRYTFAIGGNEEATRLSGINVRSYKTLVYVFASVCAAIVGVIYSGMLGSSEPTVGASLTMDSIAVAAIGGTSLAGGRGGLVGTLLGAILIGTIKNGLSLLNIVSYYQDVIIGIVIIAAVLIDYFRSLKVKE